MHHDYLDYLRPLTKYRHDKWLTVWLQESDPQMGIRLMQTTGELAALILLCVVFPHLLLRKNPGVAILLWVSGLMFGASIVIAQATATRYRDALAVIIGVIIVIATGSLISLLVRWRRLMRHLEAN